MWDFTFFGRRNGSFSAEETFEGSPLSCFPLLDIRRLRTPCRLLDGELGGLGAGKGTSVGLFSVSSSWNTDRLGCCSRTLDITSGLEGSVSSTAGRDLRALLSFAHMVVVNEVVVVVVNSGSIKVDVRLLLSGHVIVFLSRKGHMFSPTDTPPVLNPCREDALQDRLEPTEKALVRYVRRTTLQLLNI